MSSYENQQQIKTKQQQLTLKQQVKESLHRTDGGGSLNINNTSTITTTNTVTTTKTTTVSTNSQRPVSSMSSTGSATSGDSGFGFGGESPVNFICGEQTNIPLASTPSLPTEKNQLLTINEFIPKTLQETTIPNFFSDYNKTSNKEKYHQERMNNTNSAYKSSEFIPALIHQHANKLLKQNSSSSPCLIAMAAISGGVKANNNNHNNNNSNNNNVSLAYENEELLLTLPLPYPRVFSQPQQSNNLMIKSPLADLTQYINPDIHNARVNGAVITPDSTMGTITQKMNRLDAYKTVMCQAWLESIKCPFGENCKFAHGESELRPSRNQTRNVKYKTKLCEKYTTTGICPYGGRCLFIHPTAKTGNISSQYLNMNRFEDAIQKYQNPSNNGSMLAKQQSQYEFYRKYMTNNSAKQYAMANSISQQQNYPTNVNFPPLPNASSMPSVLMDPQKSLLLANNVIKGSKNETIKQTQQQQQNDEGISLKSQNMYATWSEAVLFNRNNCQHDDNFDDGESGFGSRPHPSWPLEPKGFFSERDSTSDIPALFFQQQNKNEINNNNNNSQQQFDQNLNPIKDQASMLKQQQQQQRMNFAQRFHHQSMPIFNIPQTLIHPLPSSPKNIIRNLKHEEDAFSDYNNNNNNNLNVGGGEDSSQSSYKSTSSFGLLQCSSTNFFHQNINESSTNSTSLQLASVFLPLRKKHFTNGVLHSITPDYSSQSSCASCCTSSNSNSSSNYLNGVVGRDILAEIWSSSSPENSIEKFENPFLEAAAVAAKDFEIPQALFANNCTLNEPNNEENNYQNNNNKNNFEQYYNSVSRS